MRTETTTRTLYKFDELTPEAQAKAIERWREQNNEEHFCWAGEVLDSIEKGLDSFYCELRDYSIDWSNPNRSDFAIRYPENAEELRGIRLRTWLIHNADSGTFTEPKHYGRYISGAKGRSGKYQRYSRIVKKDSCCPFTGVCYDESFLDPIRKFIAKPDPGTTFEELMNEAVNAVLRDVESEIEYRDTDEAIREELKENEYEYTKNGMQI